MRANISSSEFEEKVTRSEKRFLRKLYNRANRKGKPIIDPTKLARERIHELKAKGTALTALAYVTLLPLPAKAAAKQIGPSRIESKKV